MPRELSIELPRRLASVKVVNVPSTQATTGDESSPPQAVPGPAMPDERMAKELEKERLALRSARMALEDGINKATELHMQLQAECEQQVLDLAIAIARKVLMQEIQAGHYEIGPIVKEALQHAPSRKNVVVHMNLYDWANCQMAKDAQSQGKTEIRYVADEGVRPGECIIETSEGFVESTVESQLNNIAEAMKSPE